MEFRSHRVTGLERITALLSDNGITLVRLNVEETFVVNFTFREIGIRFKG